MNIQQLKTLLAVVEKGSFASAGESVGLSHSAVSVQIRAMEEELGVVLFDRTKRPPVPTLRGRALAEHAAKTLEMFDAVQTVATSDLVKGRLTVGAVPTVLSSFLPAALSELRKKYPELKIILKSGSSTKLASSIAAGELDVVICTKPVVEQTGMKWCKIADEPFVVLAPVDAVGMTDKDLLSSYPFIWFNRKTWAGRGIEEELKKRHINVIGHIEIDSLEAIASLVSHGLGVSIIPISKGHASLPNNVRYVTFGNPAHTREIGALISEAGDQSRAVNVFLEELTQAGS